MRTTISTALTTTAFSLRHFGVAATASTLLAAALPAAAQDQNPLDAAARLAGQGGISVADSLPVRVGNLIAAALGTLGIVFLVLTIYSGWQYMTAGGEEGKVEDAKKRIINAVIGLLITMSAYAITNFVVNLAEPDVVSSIDTSDLEQELSN